MKKLIPFLLPLLRSGLFIFVGLLVAYLMNQSLEHTAKWWSLICTFCNIITILILMIVFKHDELSYSRIIKSRINKKFTLFIIFIMLISGMGGMFLFGILLYGSIPTTMIQPIPIYLAILNVILLPLTIVFAEMPLYFGYSLNKIEKLTNNKVLAITYPMFFYAIQHSFIPLLFDWKHILFRFLSFIPLMIILGLIYYKKRELKPLMIGHAILDLATGFQILMTSLFPFIYDLMSV